MEVIAVGTAAIDVVHEVATYPKEDSKARSLGSYKCRGGNAANALVVCSQLGGRCRWLSTSTDPSKDSDAAFIHDDLAAFGVDTSLACIEAEGSMPVSYILASRESGSRTILHSRNIVELSSEAFAKQVELYMKQVERGENAPVWFHFEGRNMETVREMMLHARTRMPNAKISVEIEFPRYHWNLAKTLASKADYVFMSKDYLRENVGMSSAKEFFDGILAKQWGEKWEEWVKAFICPWGSEGVYYLDMSDASTHHIQTATLDHVVESNGAGDTFIGASLAGLSRGDVPLNIVLTIACDVATTKCTQHGSKLPANKMVKWQQLLENKAFDGVNDLSNDRTPNEDVDTTRHNVTSEVELELEQMQGITGKGGAQVFIVRQTPQLEVDSDGDVILPRKRPKWADAATSESGRQLGDEREHVFVLEVMGRSTWDTAGTQLWRAAFLLVEYIYSAPELFAEKTILELGCGIGFASIVASQLARCVYATDTDAEALLLSQRNADRNCHGDLRLRMLDWSTTHFPPTEVGDRSPVFDWFSGDEDEFNNLTVVIASDVFYDDATTILFLRMLRLIMMDHPQVKAYITLERRTVFSATAMRVVSLGYDAFQDHICRHDPSKYHTRICENQVKCRLCTTDALRFIVREVPISTFPQRFKYDRLSTLMLWTIEAVVID